MRRKYYAVVVAVVSLTRYRVTLKPPECCWPRCMVTCKIANVLKTTMKISVICLP